MKAAVMSSAGAPPRYGDFPDPVAKGEHEMVVRVLASGLHPTVRTRASGSHYTGAGQLPLVPGVDGVGRGPDGLLRYFALGPTALGAMAERTVIDTRLSVVVPEPADAVTLAAAMNPALSSWVPLRSRVRLEAGQGVLVLGATGQAGRLAVQVARRLGAGVVIAAGRNPEQLARLPQLGASALVRLGEPDADPALGELGAGVDVVLDYVWGDTAARVMAALASHRSEPTRPLTWVHIGSMAGPTAPIPGAALRSARLQVIGSGQGSNSPSQILAQLPDLVLAIRQGAFEVDARAVPLPEVEQAWLDSTGGGQRLVLVP